MMASSTTRILAHAHSDWSHDGTLSLQEWEELAAAARFHVVLLSEHEETGWSADRYQEYVAACAEHSSERVRLVPGLEFLQNGRHVLCYGLKELPARPSTAMQLAAVVRDQGCGLCLAHPAKYGWRYPDELLQAATAVEVWNSKWTYDGTWGPHPRSVRLARDHELQMFAGQDVHKRKHLTELALETESADCVRLLNEGRFRMTYDRFDWPSQQVHVGTCQGWMQQVRTLAVRKSLTLYRATKPLRSRLETRRLRALSGE